MDPVNPASLPPEYWSSLDPYANPDTAHHHSHPPPQQSTPQQSQQQQPLGIGWDHPALNSHASHRDQSHGLYPPPTPQPWQQNPLNHQVHHQPLAPPPPQDMGMPAQYRQQPQYTQGQVTFDSRAVPTPDHHPQYQPYSFSPNFYAPQHISLPDTFPQTHSPQPAQQQSRSASYQPLHQNSLPQYTLPPGFPDDPHSSLSFPSEFPQHSQRIPEQTINPQFINAQQPMGQNSPMGSNQFVYVNPAEDPKMFSYFPDGVQMQSIAPQPGMNGPLPLGHSPKPGRLPINGLKSVTIPAKPAPLRAKQPATKKQAATKKVFAKKADGKGSVSSGSDSYESDSDLEILEPEEPSPLPPARPNEPIAAAQYDALQAVWSPRNRRPKVDKVKTALVSFKDVVKNLRDSWKNSAQALKTAENKGSSDTTELRKQVALQRRLMDVVVSTTLEKGHPAIVEKLGEHPMAVSAMYSFLLDRHQASDIDGTLTLNILKLLARFVSVDEEALQKTNVAKLLPRFVKKGTPEVKALAQIILDNAAASTKRKQENGKPGSKEGSPVKNSSDAAAAEGGRRDISGSKRLRDGEANGLPAAKKVVVTSNIKPGAKPVNGAAKVGQENRPPGAASVASRPKANIVAPKPTNLFGTLSSAHKKPGTSNAERAAAAAAAKTGTGEKKDAPRPAFSFGDIMADLNKQKEPTPQESSESRTPETEEERTRRLRKESRKKLRVTWKPDDSLTDVRYFTHDPDEELGPGDRSRQVGDVKGEGSVLKLHKNIDELEEDDDGGMREEELFEYYVPSEIDTSEIPAENNFKRGGQQLADSPEAKAQDHRETTTLMVFHTSPADVPSTPKEPPAPENDEKEPEVLSFGEPPDHVLDRAKQFQAMTKPQPQPQPQPTAQSQQSQPNQNNLVFNLLKSMQTPVQQQSTPPPQTPQPAQAPSLLEQTISMLRQQQAPAQPQPQPQPQPQQPAMDQQRLWAMLYGQQQQPQQQQQPPPQPVSQPQAQPQGQQPAIPPYLAAILSQFGNQNQQAGQQPAQQAGDSSQPAGLYENPERKRMREFGGYDEDDQWKRNRMNTPNKRHPKAGSVPCRYWAEGRCRKGQDCTFRHDPQ